MTSTTPEAWAVDDTSLQTYAWNISTWGGSRQQPPPLRGQNIQIPHYYGQYWVPKVPDGRTVQLNMWVNGSNPDGTVPTDSDGRASFLQNFSALRALLWNPNRQFVVSKQILDPDTGTYVTVAGRGQYVDGFAPVMNGSHSAAFSVDIYMADPFFYGAAESASVGANFIKGDARTNAVTVTLPGGATLTNDTLGVGVTNSGGSAATLDVRNFGAVSGGANVAGNIQHFGDQFWLVLDPGLQQLSGSGSATYLPAWF